LIDSLTGFYASVTDLNTIIERALHTLLNQISLPSFNSSNNPSSIGSPNMGKWNDQNKYKLAPVKNTTLRGNHPIEHHFTKE